MQLKSYNVTVRRFDATRPADEGETFVLPVVSPDEEHAISATLSNCVAFTPKFQGGAVQPLAFMCVSIAEG